MIARIPFDPEVVAQAWLSNFEGAIREKDAHAVTACFHADGWLRESLIFCWDNRTLQGQDEIFSHISERLPNRSISNFKLDTRPHLSPEHGAIGPSQEGILSGFLFETATQWGQGYFRLIQNDDGVWRALTVYMAARDIKGHEELGRETGVYGDHMIPWSTVSASRTKSREENPEVLIIGGGQSGVMHAARFKQMNIRALVIDAHPRPGDAWRKRYNSLVLHTPRMHDQFLFQPYPSNWPLYTPKDKLANWIESYVDSQDLVVWTSTRPAKDFQPVYDEVTKRWTIVVDRAGERVSLRPAHIVCCMGTVGEPFMPEIDNHNVFRGTIVHGCEYKAPATFAGKRVVVVGAGNTAGDICIDLSTSAGSITMIQRSEITLVPVEVIRALLNHGWPDDGSIPTEVADLKFHSMPINLSRKHAQIMKAGGGGESGPYAEVYKGLREKGMIVNDGKNGEGSLFQVLDNFGGFMIDVGLSKLVISDRVKVKYGVEIASFKEESIVLSDGSEVPADAVIFATGYRPIHDEIVKIFGTETAERAGRFWCLDREGELIKVYRPSGHPALWYAGGGLMHARYASRQIALQIKASLLGLRDA